MSAVLKFGCGIFVILMSTQPVHARFLQTDPIGYQDQINLYTYVNNDPINNRDPDGLKCTGKPGAMTCVFDAVNLRDGPKLSRQEGMAAKAYERQYTAAVNRLAGNGDKSVPISVKGQQSFTVSAKDVMTTLVAAKLTYDPRGADGNALAVAGGSVGRPEITIYRGMLNETASFQQTATVHEGIHRTGSAVLAIPPGTLGIPPGRADHQKPFNDAANELLQPK